MDKVLDLVDFSNLSLIIEWPLANELKKESCFMILSSALSTEYPKLIKSATNKVDFFPITEDFPESH